MNKLIMCVGQYGLNFLCLPKEEGGFYNTYPFRLGFC